VSELGTTSAVTSNQNTLRRNILMMEAIHSSEMLVLTGATRRHSAEDGILHILRLLKYAFLMRYLYLPLSLCQHFFIILAFHAPILKKQARTCDDNPAD
jgi:hypothetical protein